MQPTVYRYDPSKSRPLQLGMLAFSLVFGLLYLTDFVSEYSESGSVSWRDLVFTVAFFVCAILWLLNIAGLGFVARKSTQVYLSLDDDGLTYGRGMRTPRRWSWTELSALECDQVSAFLRGPRILFRPVAPSVMDRLTMEITRFGSRKWLPNIYDAPFGDIAAKLNEYRDRALGSRN